MRILVAEDETDIREVYDMALTDRGHEVVLSSDGEECLKMYLQKLQADEEKQQSRQQHHHHHHRHHRHDDDGFSSLYFDVVILDYRMPKKDGLQVAKKILDINPEQRIIFASAYVQETLVESVKELKRVVELMQKPFSISALIDTVENKEAYEGLKMLMSTARDLIKDFDNNKNNNNGPSSDQIGELFEGLRKVQKFKGF